MLNSRLIATALTLAAVFALTAACGSDDGEPDETTSTQTQTQSKPTEEPKSSGPKKYDAPPPMTIDPDKKYTATFNLAKGETIVVELFAKEAPTTVNNFVFLARDGYYDGVTFHRVIPGFMAQGGDPTGTGRADRATPSRTSSAR